MLDSSDNCQGQHTTPCRKFSRNLRVISFERGGSRLKACHRRRPDDEREPVLVTRTGVRKGYRVLYFCRNKLFPSSRSGWCLMTNKKRRTSSWDPGYSFEPRDEEQPEQPVKRYPVTGEPCCYKCPDMESE